MNSGRIPFLLLFPLVMLMFVMGCGFTRTPRKSFSEESCPKPPDYSLLENWAAHPDKADLADLTPDSSIHEAQSHATADVFYIHPTTLWGGQQWNGDPADKHLNRRTERMAIRHQASIFNSAGRVYAPRYRQMVLGGFFNQDDPQSNKAAYYAAYCDVKAAFEYYLAQHNGGRPIVIASHSQGSAHAIHLLRDYFDGKDLQTQLVAAYIAGWPVPLDTMPHIPPCGSPDQTGCWVSWCSFAWGGSPSSPKWYEDAVCVNPVTWRQDTLPSDSGQHQGVVMLGYNAVYPHQVEAKVRDGYLWVTRPDLKGNAAVRGKNFHIADYNLFWMDVRRNAELRVATFTQH